MGWAFASIVTLIDVVGLRDSRAFIAPAGTA